MRVAQVRRGSSDKDSVGNQRDSPAALQMVTEVHRDAVGMMRAHRDSGVRYPKPDAGGISLGRATLTNSDMAGLDLSGADLRGAWLRGASLHGADLTLADLEGADLAEAQFDYLTRWPNGVDPSALGAKLDRG